MISSRTLRLNLAYLGKDFSGFQTQENARSVQEEIELALLKITRQNVKIIGAGRTDSGVNASHQVASCQLELKKLDLLRLTKGLNAVLPKDICIYRIDEMPTSFNARNQSIGKQYIYKIYNRISHDPFVSNHTLNIKRKLDINLMNEAGQYLIGDHNFESFRSQKCTAKHAKRYVWHLKISQEGPLTHVDIRGNAFCFNMVRIITGTLIEVGLKKRKPKSVQDTLLSLDRRQAGITAKPHGLSLARVYYPDDLSDALIPLDAVFPRYPIAKSSWPFENKDITYGPTTLL